MGGWWCLLWVLGWYEVVGGGYWSVDLLCCFGFDEGGVVGVCVCDEVGWIDFKRGLLCVELMMFDIESKCFYKGNVDGMGIVVRNGLCMCVC